VKGSNTKVRYVGLLKEVEGEIDIVEGNFKYLIDATPGEPVACVMRAREKLERAKVDVACLRPLLGEVGMLYLQLHAARLQSLRHPSD
jgi:hypothetical protein